MKYGIDDIRNLPYSTDDRGSPDEDAKQYIMCYDKNFPELEKYCGPDCFFHSWPSANIQSFAQTRDEIIVESAKPPTIDKFGWYGNLYSPIEGAVEKYTRPLLKEIGDEHSDMFDIVHISPVSSSINKDTPNYISLPELTKYEYLIDIGGNGFSGRLKWLFFSKRPLLMIDRNYIEFFYHDLKPYVHYIPVKMDLSDLVEQAKWVKANHDKCLEIANNAYDYALSNFTEDKIIDRVYYVYNNIIADKNNNVESFSQIKDNCNNMSFYIMLFFICLAISLFVYMMMKIYKSLLRNRKMYRT